MYCDNRSNCYRFTHRFEAIKVKQNAPELLKAGLRKKRTPLMIGTGSMSDLHDPEACFADLRVLPEKSEQLSLL